MTTGLAFAVLTLAAVGTAAAAVFVLRAVPAAQAQGSAASVQPARDMAGAGLDNPPTLAHQTMLVSSGEQDEPSLRTARVTPEETRPTLVPVRPPVNLVAMGEYDPDQESEDDVPTTLFHSEDTAEIEAFVADLEEKRGR
jgi:hypothetical protein